MAGGGLRQRRRPIQSRVPTADEDDLAVKRKRTTDSSLPLWVLLMLIGSSLCSALFAPIGDCDETYNYWEPTHLLLYGSGLQTWEYSPAFALRSYIYVGAHAVIGYIIALFGASKVMVFFAIRIALSLVNAAALSRLISSIHRKTSRDIMILSAIMVSFSSGMHVAASSFLPQSFAMYAITLAVAEWIDGISPTKTIFWVSVAGLIGWPFALLVAIPIGFDLVYRNGLFCCVRSGVASGAICIGSSLIVDRIMYGKWVIAIAQIVLYNAFTTQGANIYGVEPWHFVMRNLFLNFNVALPLASAAVPLVVIRSSSSNNVIRTAVQLAGIWIPLTLIFTIMAHKEERFLFPVFPLIAVSAAIAIKNLPRAIRWTAIFAFICMSLSRTIAVTVNYRAPFEIYMSLPNDADNVCVGKEWYRFPSSFFLPQSSTGSDLLFLKSGFTGLLPKPFQRGHNSTSAVPSGMNGMNKEEFDRYSSVSQCEYIVDFDLAEQAEPHYHKNAKEWTVVASVQFLDSANSRTISRAFWIPFFSARFTSWRPYVLLRRISSISTKV